MPIVTFLLLLGANPYLDQAKTLYDGLQFERCLGRLEQAAQVPSTDEERVDIELFGGLCASSLGRESLARDHFEIALKLNPQVQLPKLTSPRIVQLFEKVAAEVRQKAPAVEPTPAPEPAPTPTPAPEVKPPVAELAAPPPTPARRAWWLPSTFTGATVAASAVAIGFGVSARGHEQSARAAVTGGWEVDIAREGDRARSDALAANIAWTVAGVLLAVSVVTWLVVALGSSG